MFGCLPAGTAVLSLPHFLELPFLYIPEAELGTFSCPTWTEPKHKEGDICVWKQIITLVDNKYNYPAARLHIDVEAYY